MKYWISMAQLDSFNARLLYDLERKDYETASQYPAADADQTCSAPNCNTFMHCTNLGNGKCETNWRFIVNLVNSIEYYCIEKHTKYIDYYKNKGIYTELMKYVDEYLSDDLRELMRKHEAEYTSDIHYIPGCYLVAKLVHQKINYKTPTARLLVKRYFEWVPTYKTTICDKVIVAKSLLDFLLKSEGKMTEEESWWTGKKTWAVIIILCLIFSIFIPPLLTLGVVAQRPAPTPAPILPSVYRPVYPLIRKPEPFQGIQTSLSNIKDIVNTLNTMGINITKVDNYCHDKNLLCNYCCNIGITSTYKTRTGENELAHISGIPYESDSYDYFDYGVNLVTDRPITEVKQILVNTRPDFASENFQKLISTYMPYLQSTEELQDEANMEIMKMQDIERRSLDYYLFSLQNSDNTPELAKYRKNNFQEQTARNIIVNNFFTSALDTSIPRKYIYPFSLRTDRCNPRNPYRDNLCMSEKDLLDVAKAFKIEINLQENGLSITNDDKRHALWKQISPLITNETSSCTTGDAWCVLYDARVKSNVELRQRLSQKFRPALYKNVYEMNDLDSYNFLKQIQNDYPEVEVLQLFQYPIDFEERNYKSVISENYLEEIKSKGKTKFVIYFGNENHAVAIFGDLLKKQIIYSNSWGSRKPFTMDPYRDREHTININATKLANYINKNREMQILYIPRMFQVASGQCGMFALHVIQLFIDGMEYSDFINMPIQYMNDYRMLRMKEDVYFRPSIEERGSNYTSNYDPDLYKSIKLA
jgi:hypothetical protein